MKLNLRFWGVVFFGVLVYALLSMYADFVDLGSAFKHFNAWFLLPLFPLIAISCLTRFIRWEFFLRKAGVHITLKDSLFVFFSGLPMTLTPGKTGELWKAWLIKDKYGEELSKTIPVVIIERVADVLGAIIPLLIGLLYYQQNIYFVLAIIFAFACLFAAIRSKSISGRIVSILEKRSGKYAENIRTMHQTFDTLMDPRGLVAMSLLASVGWLLECLMLYLVIIGFDESASMILATFVFTVSSLAGGFSMIPGGLGVADAGISGLLKASGIAAAAAVGAAIITRSVTLWFQAVIGYLVYFCFRRKYYATENGIGYGN